VVTCGSAAPWHNLHPDPHAPRKTSPPRRCPTVSARGGVVPPLTPSRLAGTRVLVLQLVGCMPIDYVLLIYNVYKRAHRHKHMRHDTLACCCEAPATVVLSHAPRTGGGNATVSPPSQAVDWHDILRLLGDTTCPGGADTTGACHLQRSASPHVAAQEVVRGAWGACSMALSRAFLSILSLATVLGQARFFHAVCAGDACTRPARPDTTHTLLPRDPGGPGW
jgi:hypothetical protein